MVQGLLFSYYSTVIPVILVTIDILACSRLQDGGGKSFSNKKCEKRAAAGDYTIWEPGTGYRHPSHPGQLYMFCEANKGGELM